MPLPPNEAGRQTGGDVMQFWSGAVLQYAYGQQSRQPLGNGARTAQTSGAGGGLTGGVGGGGGDDGGRGGDDEREEVAREEIDAEIDLSTSLIDLSSRPR